MSPLTDEMATVRLRRTLSAPPERMFQAWLEPELLPRWIAPEGLTVTRAEAAARHRGRFRLWYAGPEGDAGGIEARLMAFEMNRRLVFRWGFCGPERLAGPIYDSLLTLRFREAEAATTDLSLVHANLGPLRAARPERADGITREWVQALAKLDELAA